MKKLVLLIAIIACSCTSRIEQKPSPKDSIHVEKQKEQPQQMQGIIQMPPGEYNPTKPDKKKKPQ